MKVNIIANKVYLYTMAPAGTGTSKTLVDLFNT